jgi:hypothetical protein
MTKLQAKQIQGAVDNETDQIIGGEKTFNEGVNFLNDAGSSVNYIRIEDGWIYWTKSPAILNADGNMRIGRNPTTGAPLAQVNNGGTWVNANF